jgi:hypothetical protein
MYSILILVVLVAVVIIALAVWAKILPTPSPKAPSVGSPDFKIVRTTILNDAHLQRLLMIEIIRSSQSPTVPITFDKIEGGIATLNKSLVKFLGGASAQTITNLMRARAQTIRTYYEAMQNVVCTDDVCLYIKDSDEAPIVKPIAISSDKPDPNNLTHEVNTNLAQIRVQIIGAMANSTHLATLPIKLDRMANLITMYDQEIINQARAYASHQYDISMNCHQSVIEIANHLGAEFNTIMRLAQPATPHL